MKALTLLALALQGVSAAVISARQKTPLIAVPLDVCAAVLGLTRCAEQTPTPGGLVNIPVDACIGVIGLLKCSLAAAPSGGGTPSVPSDTLISIPIDLCAIVIGSVRCAELPKNPDGTVDIPIGICLGVIGISQCPAPPKPSGTASATPKPTHGGGGSTSAPPIPTLPPLPTIIPTPPGPKPTVTSNTGKPPKPTVTSHPGNPPVSGCPPAVTVTKTVTKKYDDHDDE